MAPLAEVSVTLLVASMVVVAMEMLVVVLCVEAPAVALAWP